NGGILKNAGLPENFIVVNPQFGSVGMVNNDGNSSYEAFQAHIAKRFSHGVTGQFSYTFSKTLGDTNGLFVRDQRNLRLNKGLLNIERTQLFQWNILYDVPVGKGKTLLTNAPGIVNQIVGGWQISSSFQWQSGVPLSFTTTDNTLNFRGTNTANLVGALPSDFSQVVKGNGFVQYFPTLAVAPAPTPNFGGDPTLPGRFTNFNVVDSTGKVILTNPEPGTTGNTALNFPGLRGPGLMGFNASA